MATGTGSGTPAAGASALMLNGLRDRIRTPLEHAHGAPDPVPILSSTETLATLRDGAKLHLQDSGNTKWACHDIKGSASSAASIWLSHPAGLSPLPRISSVKTPALARMNLAQSAVGSR